MCDGSTRASVAATSRRWWRVHAGRRAALRGHPVGPFVGREAIHAAYQDQPPEDEVEILGSEIRNGVIVARYAWLRDHGKQAGEMRLVPRGGRIEKLVVTFG